MSSAVTQRQGSRWLRSLLLVLMVALPFAEIFLLVQVGQAIGVWWTLAILIVEALLGAWLIQREGSRAWKALNGAFATGKMPAGELADTALILVGGVLLMMPGFISDIVGLVFLLPFTRPLARKALAYLVARRMAKLGLVTTYHRRDGTVIEGETVEPAPRNGHPAPPDSSRLITGEIDDGVDQR